MSFFKIHQKSKKTNSRARTGQITTAHGVINTPAFVSVGTKGTIKSVTPEQAIALGVQASFVNTYHLVVHPGVDVISSNISIHEYSGMKWPLLSDSGGFQIFSLADRAKRGKLRDGEEAILQKITEDEVTFRSVYNGEKIIFSPELSILYQQKIGADICMAFDECVYYGATKEYAKKSMDMTHRWLDRCISSFGKNQRADYQQYLYGIIQGSTYEDLRIESAKYIHSKPTPGVAIGGVSVGESKSELRDQVRWVSPYLPDDRPVHLLGVGHLDDIIDLVGYGVDTFDCVEATRLARLGVLLHIDNLDKSFGDWKLGKIDITELKYKTDYQKLNNYHNEMNNNTTFTRSYLHHLFKQKELLAYNIATLYNLSVMESLMLRIREEIEFGNI
ncbi:MAG: tRNA guanosine(34) transglycosylase Tgt [Patescibacteria group bacterium]